MLQDELHMLIENPELYSTPERLKEAARISNELKRSSEGWKLCMRAILFVCQQDTITQRYATSDLPSKVESKNFMLSFLNIYANSPFALGSFVRKKIAFVISCYFVADYSHNTSQVIIDELFLNSISREWNSKLVELYLLALIEIHSEIGDRDTPYTKEETERNTRIKDSMRDVCIPQMVDSWLIVLQKVCAVPPVTNDEKIPNLKLAGFCLNVIGYYISWIDLKLIANEKFMPLIVQLFKVPETQEKACDCLCSILSKGMEPSLKIELILAMDAFFDQMNILDFAQYAKDEIDVITNLSALANCTGIVLIDCWNKLVKSYPTEASKCLDMIEIKLAQMMQYLAYDDLNVSQSVTEFTGDYVGLLKQLSPPQRQSRREFVRKLIITIIKRFRFPDDYNHDSEGEEEAEFLEYRKEMRTLFINVGLLDPELVMQVSAEFIKDILGSYHLQQASIGFCDVELALFVLYQLAEALVSNAGNILIPTNPHYSATRELVHMMIRYGVCNEKSHACVALQYFECICRYDKFVADAEEDALIAQVLATFMEHGLHNDSAMIRSRTAYLFSRFVKCKNEVFRSLRSALNQHVGEILSRLEDLLAISPTSATNQLLSSNDLLFIYEAAATLIVNGNFSAELKQQYMQQLLGSLFEKFSTGFEMLKASKVEEEKIQYLEFLNSVMSFSSRTSKAFTPQFTMTSCHCSEIFLKLMNVYLESLSNDYPGLLNGARQYLHRMVLCLGDEFLPFVPSIVTVFVNVIPDIRALQDFLLLLQQIIGKFKAKVVPYLQPLISSIYTAVLELMTKRFDPELDEVVARDFQYLRRAYYQIIALIVTHKILPLIFDIENQLRDQVLSSIVFGVSEIGDPVAQKSCVSIASRLLDSAEIADSQLFYSFMLAQILPACLSAPLKTEFDIGDAQAVLLLNEIGLFFHKIYSIKNEEICKLLSDQLFPNAQVSKKLTDDFCVALRSCDTKSFQKFLRTFFTNLRQSIGDASAKR